MGETINALTDIDTLELTLCKRGKNKKRYAFAKSEEGNMADEILEALGPVLEVETEGEDKIGTIFKAVSPKGKDAVKGAMRLLSGFKDELPGDVMGGLADLAGFDRPVAKAEPADEDEAKKKAEAKKAKEEKEAMDAKNKDNPKPKFGEPVKKADGTYEFSDDVPEEVRAHLAMLWKAKDVSDERATQADNRATEAEKLLKSERDERLLKDFIQKSADEYSHVGESEELGAMLLELHGSNPELQAKVEKQMAASEKRIAEGALLTELGSSGGNRSAGSAWAKICKMAEGIVQKSENGITEAAARDRVMQEHPDLYNEYLSENPAQTGRRD